VSVYNLEEAKRFFETYDIPYEVVSCGENKGRLRIIKIGERQRNELLEVRRMMENAGLGTCCDHSNVFQDSADRTVITFSPYHTVANLEQIIMNGLFGGYSVEISDYSICGLGTRTIEIRSYL
jgi:hypothetical protein